MPVSLSLSDALGHALTDKRIDILRHIGACGSISQAARAVGVSYKAAWQALDTLTNLAGTPLVSRAVGGAGGGGAQLTDAGRDSPLAALDALGEVPVLHWHGDQFGIPPGAQCLAGTATCPHQGFALGPQVLGLQCHLEADPRAIEGWLVGHACELAQAGVDPRTLRAEAQALQARLPAVPRLLLHGHVCRRELAVEIDGVHA